MLLRVLFLCFAVAVLGETMLQGAAALAMSVLREQGVAAASSTFASAAQLAQSAIAAGIEAGGVPPSTLPSPTATCVLGDGSACALTASATITLATPAPTACPSAGCGAYLQGNDDVGEGRIVAAITAVVRDASGAEVAARSGSLVFRTLLVPPYAVADGALDATLDGSESGAGDLGGLAPANSANGTLVDVVYENASTGALMPANVWNGLPAGAPITSGWSP